MLIENEKIKNQNYNVKLKILRLWNVVSRFDFSVLI